MDVRPESSQKCRKQWKNSDHLQKPSDLDTTSLNPNRDLVPFALGLPRETEDFCVLSTFPSSDSTLRKRLASQFERHDQPTEAPLTSRRAEASGARMAYSALQAATFVKS